MTMRLELNDERTDPYLFVWKHIFENNVWNIQNNANILLLNTLQNLYPVSLGFGEQGIIWSKVMLVLQLEMTEDHRLLSVHSVVQ